MNSDYNSILDLLDEHLGKENEEEIEQALDDNNPIQPKNITQQTN